MKVKDLIRALKKYDDEVEINVLKNTDWYEYSMCPDFSIEEPVGSINTINLY